MFMKQFCLLFLRLFLHEQERKGQNNLALNGTVLT